MIIETMKLGEKEKKPTVTRVQEMSQYKIPKGYIIYGVTFFPDWINEEGADEPCATVYICKGEIKRT